MTGFEIFMFVMLVIFTLIFILSLTGILIYDKSNIGNIKTNNKNISERYNINNI